MKIVAKSCIAVVLLCIATALPAREPVRIDATTESSFDKSFSQLVKSLKGRERRVLALALFSALVSHECLSPDTILYLTFQPVTPKDSPRIRSCREHLNGKSYQDLVEAAELQDMAFSPTLPNNAFKPTPLRSANHMAGTACHMVCSTTRRGLT